MFYHSRSRYNKSYTLPHLPFTSHTCYLYPPTNVLLTRIGYTHMSPHSHIPYPYKHPFSTPNTYLHTNIHPSRTYLPTYLRLTTWPTYTQMQTYTITKLPTNLLTYYHVTYLDITHAYQAIYQPTYNSPHDLFYFTDNTYLPTYNQHQPLYISPQRLPNPRLSSAASPAWRAYTRLFHPPRCGFSYYCKWCGVAQILPVCRIWSGCSTLIASSSADNFNILRIISGVSLY